MRLAWFSPMPPIRTGIASCSAELVAALRSTHEIDVFVDRPALAKHDGTCRSAHDFVWEHRQRPYDLVVYQLGNSSHHDYIWPYLFRYPGLAVLHDVHLHHARAALLLRERRPVDYRAEFAINEPDANPDAAELAIAGFDSFQHYQWPFTRLVCATSRLTAVHSRVMCDELRGQMPEARIEHVRLGHGTFVPPSETVERNARARIRYRIPEHIGRVRMLRRPDAGEAHSADSGGLQDRQALGAIGAAPARRIASRELRRAVRRHAPRAG